MFGSTSSGRGPNCEADVMGHFLPPALQKKAEEALGHHPIVPAYLRRTQIHWVLQLEGGTLTRGRAGCLDRELPKNGDLPKSPLSPMQPDAVGRRDFNLKNKLLRITVAGRKSMTRSLIIVASAAIILTLAPTAFAQQPGQFGTAAEAKAMLGEAAAAVKSDKAKALDMIARGDLKDRDLYPFCFNLSDGKIQPYANPNATNFGQDVRTQKDVNGKAWGVEFYAAAQKPEGQITEVSYVFPKPGSDKTPVAKETFITRVGDLGCGVGYYN
jgi:hypothetical protein